MSTTVSDEQALAGNSNATVGVPQKRRKVDIPDKVLEPSIKQLSKVQGSSDAIVKSC